MASNRSHDTHRVPAMVDGIPVFVHQRVSTSGYGHRTVTREIVAPGARSADVRGPLLDIRTKSGLSKAGFERV